MGHQLAFGGQAVEHLLLLIERGCHRKGTHGLDRRSAQLVLAPRVEDLGVQLADGKHLAHPLGIFTESAGDLLFGQPSLGELAKCLEHVGLVHADPLNIESKRELVAIGRATEVAFDRGIIGNLALLGVETQRCQAAVAVGNEDLATHLADVQRLAKAMSGD